MNSQLESTVHVWSALPVGGFAVTRGGWTGLIFGLLRREIRLSTDDEVLGDDAENKSQKLTNMTINATNILEQYVFKVTKALLICSTYVIILLYCACPEEDSKGGFEEVRSIAVRDSCPLLLVFDVELVVNQP